MTSVCVLCVIETQKRDNGFKILTKNYNTHHHSRDRENRKEKATFIWGEENKGKQENGVKGGGGKIIVNGKQS